MYIKTGMYDVLISLPTALYVESVCSLTELFFCFSIAIIIVRIPWHIGISDSDISNVIDKCSFRSLGYVSINIIHFNIF